jgi:FAD/FMN-containing dehydrogenase
MVDRQDERTNLPSGYPLEEATVEEFAASFGGELIRPEDIGYDEARKVYNGMIDRRPALIVRPTGSADVIDAVNLARENGLPLAVRCGGHSVAGKGVVDDGVLIDLSSLKGVRVDPKSHRARANAGALWGEFDRETQIFGLATPGDGLRRLVSVASRWEAATAGSLRSGV